MPNMKKIHQFLQKLWQILYLKKRKCESPTNFEGCFQKKRLGASHVTKLGTVACVHPLVLNAKYEEDSAMSSKVMTILNFEKWAIFRIYSDV